ncbi:MAG: hypothetical protein ACK5QW_06930 [Cyanobacteriota bacterium]
MDFPLHLQEQGGIRDPFSLAASEPEIKDFGAAPHPAGDRALIALHLGGSLRASAMPDEKVKAGKFLLRDHDKQIFCILTTGSWKRERLLPPLGGFP